MCWHLGSRERVSFLSALLSEGMAGAARAHADMNWRAAPHVGEGKTRLSVAAVGCAEERVERLVLVDGQDLPITKGPPTRREVKAYDFDLSEKRF